MQCNICQQIYKHRSGGKQGGTGTLMRHIAEDHKRELNIAKGGGDVGGSTQIRMDPATGVAKKYNKLKDREEIAKMVAVGCLPFSFPSSDTFIRYIQQFIILCLMVFLELLVGLIFLDSIHNIIFIYQHC